MDRMTERRRVLECLVTVGAVSSFTGCSTVWSSLGGNTDQEQSKGAATRSVPRDTATRPTTCDGTSASHIFTFGGSGYSVVVDDTSTAKAIAADLYSSSRITAQTGSEPYINARKADEKIHVRLGDTNASLADVRAVVGDRNGVTAIRRGQPLPTLETAAENVGDRAGIEDNPRDVVRTSVIDSDETEAAYVEMLLFDPPLRLLLVLRSPQSTEFRVQTADGEKRLATGRDFQTVDPGSRARLRRGESGWRVLMVLKSAARPEWRSTLRQFDVLSNPDEHPLRVYSTETQLAETTLTPEFAALVRSGDWTGEIGWPADSRPTANQVRLALERPYRSGSLTSCG